MFELRMVSRQRLLTNSVVGLSSGHPSAVGAFSPIPAVNYDRAARHICVKNGLWA